VKLVAVLIALLQCHTHATRQDVNFQEVQDAASAQCLEHSLSGSFPLTSLTTINTAATSLSSCVSSACNLGSTAIILGYSFVNNVCHVITGGPMNAVMSSAVCMKRGGCDGTKENSNCVWRDLPSFDLSSLLAVGSTLAVSTESLCRLQCASLGTCIGYTFDFQSVTCKLFQPSTLNQGGISAFLLPSLWVKEAPFECSRLESCGNVIVVVPVQYGDPTYVTISTPNGVGGSTIVETSGGIAQFPNVQFAKGGNQILEVSTSLAMCPTFSHQIVVSDKFQNTVFRGIDSDFPYGDSNFFLMRLGDNCKFVPVVAAGLTGLFLILSILVFRAIFLEFDPKAIVYTGLVATLVGVIQMDAMSSWELWNCSTTAKEMAVSLANTFRRTRITADPNIRRYIAS